MTLHQIIQFFIKYKYQAIFPVAVLEGPFITIISGFLVSRGRLDLFPALMVVFLGDVVSDIAFHLAGRGSRYVIKYLNFLHITPERLERLENRFQISPWRTMIIAKLSYGLGAVFMVASGAVRMSWKSFFEYILSLNFIRSYLLLCIGFYFGRAALHIGPTYLKYYIIGIVIIVPASYFIYNRKVNKTF